MSLTGWEGPFQSDEFDLQDVAILSVEPASTIFG